jgi:hypothetical protein
LTNFVQKNEKKSLQKNTSRWRERFFIFPNLFLVVMGKCVPI